MNSKNMKCYGLEYINNFRFIINYPDGNKSNLVINNVPHRNDQSALNKVCCNMDDFDRRQFILDKIPVMAVYIVLLLLTITFIISFKANADMLISRIFYMTSAFALIATFISIWLRHYKKGLIKRAIDKTHENMVIYRMLGLKEPHEIKNTDWSGIKASLKPCVKPHTAYGCTSSVKP